MLEQLKMLLGKKDDGEDALLSFLITRITDLILGYCHIDTIPTKLESLIPVMTADMYRRKGYGTAEAPEFVRSVSQGKRSISVESDVLSDDTVLLNDYREQLKPFVVRRGKVPSDINKAVSE